MIGRIAGGYIEWTFNNGKTVMCLIDDGVAVVTSGRHSLKLGADALIDHLCTVSASKPLAQTSLDETNPFLERNK